MNGRSTHDDTAGFIWATRGRTWGFRFLRRGGRANPLSEYEAMFLDIGEEPEAWRRVAGKVGLRFPDPDGRRDAAGRVIPHDFVLFGTLAAEVDSLDDGRQRVWPEVADDFDTYWDKADPPPASR